MMIVVRTMNFSEIFQFVATLAGSVISTPTSPENITELLEKFIPLGMNLAPISCFDTPTRLPVNCKRIKF